MFPRLRFLLLVLPAWGVAFTGRAADHPLKIEPPALWITAYYPGWEQRTLPPGEIDFKAITHLVQFSVMPRADGGVDWGKHGVNEDLVKETVRLAHVAGRKILLCVGGADSAPAFRAALAGSALCGRWSKRCVRTGMTGWISTWSRWRRATPRLTRCLSLNCARR